MQYDLDNLGSENFEHLVQALLVRDFGFRSRVYGQGKDGGRELTFEGVTEIGGRSNDARAWDGYVLAQAKFCNDRLGTSKDQAWFLRTVAAEMDVWANPKSERRAKGVRIPEYIVFATNVRLSPASGGGLDDFDALMSEYQKDLPLRGWHVLHREQLERMLDGALDVRRRYSALIAPADALGSSQDLVGLHGDFKAALVKHASKLISSERIIRLSEQGLKTGDKLFLEEVGVDLPSSIPSTTKARTTVSTLRYIMNHGDQILSPMGGPKRAEPPHLMIVGGPGQGKTTLSQMLTQFYRVALIDEYSSEQSPRRIAEVAEATRATMKSLRIPKPKNRRWPMRIDLAEYGDAISGGEELTILRWITKVIARRSETTASGASTQKWFESWPWLLVLDGLDEVAHATVRERVRSAIEDLMVEAADANADLLLVLTTRPQGFETLFSQDEFLELTLEKLHRDQALHYAEKVAAIRNHDDEGLREASLSRLSQAFKQPTTARLMSTPLQVTIMLLLFEIAAKVPRSRYDLFSDYFETVYSRETAKPGHLAALLEAHRSDIAHVHQHVGLRLQMSSESSFNAESILNRVELREIIFQRLRSEGNDEATAGSLTERLMLAALHRLVLLVPRGEGLGFEVRSLQEFMAASQLTTGPDVQVLERLAVIAPSAHWRNTLLLAVGRIFADREHLRGPTLALLRQIDAADEGGGAADLGPDLALACLDEGVADRAPVFGRLLFMHVLEVLRYPPRLGHPNVMAKVCTEMSTDPKCRELVVDALKAADDGSIQTRAGAIVLMTNISELKFYENPLWIFVRDNLPLWKDRLMVDERDVIEAWSRGGGVQLDVDTQARVPETKDRVVGIGDLLRDSNAADSGIWRSGRLRTVVDELNQATVVLLEPDFDFACPPTEAPRSPVLTEAFDESGASQAWMRAAAGLRAGYWPVAAHAYGLAREVRSRRSVVDRWPQPLQPHPDAPTLS